MNRILVGYAAVFALAMIVRGADLKVYNEATGQWYIRTLDNNSGVRSSQGGTIITWGTQWGGPGFKPVSGTFSGKTNEMIVYNEQGGGYWYGLTQDGEISKWGEQWGGPGYEERLADYDGDGITDLAVVDMRNLAFYIKFSSTGEGWYWKFSSQTVPEGDEWRWASGAGDLDGDGKADPFFLMTWTGTIYYFSSFQGRQLTDFFDEDWENTQRSLVPIVGKFYEDTNCENLAVYDRLNGIWEIHQNSLKGPDSGDVSVQFGGEGFTPFAKDMNGDSVSDLVVYDTKSGNWYAMSINGEIITWQLNWGSSEMTPVE